MFFCRQGYYRVNYDLTNWNLITNQLLTNFNQISLIGRSQLLDDSLNIARAEYGLAYSVPLNLTQYLTGERNYVPWKSATNGLGYIDLMFVLSAGYGDFRVRSGLFRHLYSFLC